MVPAITPWIHASSPDGVEKIDYRSEVDGRDDWALSWPPVRGRTWVVHLHGHGSSGDQVFTRGDIRDLWLSHYRMRGLGVLSPNLRANAWMCPEAVTDLHALVAWARRHYDIGAFLFLSGSMGGTGNLIYAIRHPEDVDAVAALCPVTDIAAYHDWCSTHPGGVRDEIRLAIEASYGGSPDACPARYAAHTVTRDAAKLTMPVFLSHASGDEVIPVQQSRELRRCMGAAPNLHYVEIQGGDHDTPLHQSGMLEWVDRHVTHPKGTLLRK